MFHTHVTASAGHRVDIGRAQFLMDRDVWADAADWVDAHWSQESGETREQAFFACYSRLHRAKHGRPFEPDVNPAWD